MLYQVKIAIEEVTFEGEPINFLELKNRLEARKIIIPKELTRHFLYLCQASKELIMTGSKLHTLKPQKEPVNENIDIWNDVTLDVSEELRILYLIGDASSKGFETAQAKKAVFCVARSRYKGCLGPDIAKYLGAKTQEYHHILTRLCDYGVLLRFSTIQNKGANTGDEAGRVIVMGKQRTGQQTVFFHYRFFDEKIIFPFREEQTDTRLQLVETKILELVAESQLKCVLEDDLFQACNRAVFDAGLPRRGMYRVFQRVYKEMIRNEQIESVKMPCDAEPGSGLKDAFATALAQKGVHKYKERPSASILEKEIKKPMGPISERPTLTQMANLITLSGKKGLSTMEIEDIMGFTTKECYTWLEIIQKYYPMKRALESVGKFHINRYFDACYADDAGPPSKRIKTEPPTPASEAKSPGKSNLNNKSTPSSPARKKAKTSSPAVSSTALVPTEKEAFSSNYNPLGRAPSSRTNATKESRIEQIFAHIEENRVTTFPILRDILIPFVGTLKTMKVLCEEAIKRDSNLRLERRSGGHEMLFLYDSTKITQPEALEFAMGDIKRRLAGPNKSRPNAERDQLVKAQQQVNTIDVDVDDVRLNAVQKGLKKAAMRKNFDVKIAVYYGYIYAPMMRLQEWHIFLTNIFMRDDPKVEDSVVISLQESMDAIDVFTFSRLIGVPCMNQYISNYMTSENQEPTLMKDLPQEIKKELTLNFNRGTHMDQGVRRLWSHLIKMGYAEFAPDAEDDVERPQQMSAVFAKTTKYRLQRYYKIPPFISRNPTSNPVEEEEQPFDLKDPMQLHAQWESIKQKCLDFIEDGISMLHGGRFAGWTTNAADEEKNAIGHKKKAPQAVEPPINFEFEMAFRRSNWKACLYVTCAQRKALDNFLEEWRLKKDITDKDGNPKPRIITLAVPEVVQLAAKIGLSPKNVVEYVQQRNQVFVSDVIEVSKLKTLRYRCHICAYSTAHIMVITEHYQKTHNQHLPAMNRYMTPEYYEQRMVAAKQLELQIQEKNTKTRRDGKKTRKRVRKPVERVSLTKRISEQGGHEGIDWLRMHKVWFDMCGIKSFSLACQPPPDDPMWDLLARLVGKPKELCIQRMDYVTRHRAGTENFEKYSVKEQARTFEAKACEMCIRSLFLSPPNEYVASLAFASMSLHSDICLAALHDDWKDKGWILLTKHRERKLLKDQEDKTKIPSKEEALAAQGADRPKFALTRRVKSKLYGFSNTFYRWAQQLRNTVDLQCDDEVTWPDITGDMIFALSESVDVEDASLELMWEDNFDAMDWEDSRREELKEFIKNYKEKAPKKKKLEDDPVEENLPDIDEDIPGDDEDSEKEAGTPKANTEHGHYVKKADPIQFKFKGVSQHLEISKIAPIYGIRWSGLVPRAHQSKSEWLNRMLRIIVEYDMKPFERNSETGETRINHQGLGKINYPFMSYESPVYETYGETEINIDNKSLVKTLQNIPATGVPESTLNSDHIEALELLRLVIAIPDGKEFRIYPIIAHYLHFFVTMPTRRVSSTASGLAEKSRFDRQYGPKPANAALVEKRAKAILKAIKMAPKQEYQFIPWNKCLPTGIVKLGGLLNCEFMNMLMPRIWLYLYYKPGTTAQGLSKTLCFFDVCEILDITRTFMKKWVKEDEHGNLFCIPIRDLEVKFF